MLKTRVITAIALLGIFLPVLWFAPLMYLGALIAIVITLAAWEWWRLLFPDNQRRAFSYAGLCLLNLVAWLMYADIEAVKVLLWLTLGFWLLVVPFIMKQSLQLSLQSWRWPLAAIGLFILPACWFALMHLRAVSMALFLSVLILVWAADIGAYFAGKAFGKNKLAKQLSPGKSIEGAIGGYLLVMVIGVLGATLFADHPYTQDNFFALIQSSWGWSGMILMITLCVAMSIQGDLFESQLKRVAGVKDSSALLPGHGGFLDRIDALLPVLPLAGLIILMTN
uniref:phosphatidate cytidylyltransferase n=1 Tax=Polynucleobacter sp. TaxID=2029855 RepID=UPI0040478A6D